VDERPIKRLADYHEDVIRFGLPEFIENHGEAFMLHHGPIDKLKISVGRKATVRIEASSIKPEGSFSPGTDYLVFPIYSPLAEESGEQTISIGRSEANEVTVPDDSVSEFHAFVQLGADGKMSVQDMNSTNGTFVNEMRVPAQGEGHAVTVMSGDQIRLGNLTFSFLSAAEFRKLVNSLVGS
jgi:pSer/pThr/pTyr-binding forkhead associated (FHA) protein